VPLELVMSYWSK